MMMVALFALMPLAGCVIAPAPPGYEVEVAPPLPAVVVLDVEPYYYHSGYYYYYQNDNWRYSRSRSGPWTELPRSHWPKEVRRKGDGEHRHEHEER